MINAEIIKDSMSKTGYRITTFRLEYPRFIHSEVMTYRMFSRNSESSRAIGMRRRLDAEPYYPKQSDMHYDERGMRYNTELSDVDYKTASTILAEIYDYTKSRVEDLVAIGLHRQHAARYLEPFSMHKAIVTSNEQNFRRMFDERIRKGVQPEMVELCSIMKSLLDNSKAIRRSAHLPFVEHEDGGYIDFDTFAPISAARCSRVTYGNESNKKTEEEEFGHYTRLVNSGHMSPLEHACVDSWRSEMHRNNIGWASLRSLIETNEDNWKYFAMTRYGKPEWQIPYSSVKGTLK